MGQRGVENEDKYTRLDNGLMSYHGGGRNRLRRLLFDKPSTEGTVNDTATQQYCSATRHYRLEDEHQ